MATAVGRGRSRGIRGGRTAGVSTISSPCSTPTQSEASPQISQPDSGVSFTETPKCRVQEVANMCVRQLREHDTDGHTECVTMLQECLISPETCSKWVEACISAVSGDFPLSHRLIQLLAFIQTSQSITNSKEVVASTLRVMNQQMNQLKPEDPVTMSEDQSEKFAAFTVLLAEVALSITRHDGQPLRSLTWVMLTECLQVLAQPGLPHKVYLAMHHVLLRYGAQLKQHIELLGPDKLVQVELLFDQIRSIVIHDSTMDKSRVLMLELIERKAHQHNMPQELLDYYSSHSNSLLTS